MDNTRVVPGRRSPLDRDAFVLPHLMFARLVRTLAVVVSIFLCNANTALSATFTLDDGGRIEGEIIYASKSSVVVRDRTGTLMQLGRRSIRRVDLVTDIYGVVGGMLKSWAAGIYEIETEDKFIKIEASRVVAERQISLETTSPVTASPEIVVSREIIVTGTEKMEDAAELDFKVGLTAPMTREVRLIYSTEDGTARAGSDYEAVRGDLILEPGSTETAIRIRLLDDDLAEGSETFELIVISDLDLDKVKVWNSPGFVDG